MISFIIEDQHGKQTPIDMPEGINLSLMEVIKAAEFNVPATCGGLALCATCLVKVTTGLAKLDAPKDAEQDMLDTLPGIEINDRLSCQIHVTQQLNTCVFRLGQ
jgi:ferredoxin